MLVLIATIEPSSTASAIKPIEISNRIVGTFSPMKLANNAKTATSMPLEYPRNFVASHNLESRGVIAYPLPCPHAEGPRRAHLGANGDAISATESSGGLDLAPAIHRQASASEDARTNIAPKTHRT